MLNYYKKFWWEFNEHEMEVACNKGPTIIIQFPYGRYDLQNCTVTISHTYLHRIWYLQSWPSYPISFVIYNIISSHCLTSQYYLQFRKLYSLWMSCLNYGKGQYQRETFSWYKMLLKNHCTVTRHWQVSGKQNSVNFHSDSVSGDRDIGSHRTQMCLWWRHL